MEPADLRIVLADDHKIVLEALELSLARSGFQVVAKTTTPQQAFESCLSTSADVLITDLLMVGGDGLEAARQVHLKLPGCRVIVLTSSRSPWHLARAKQSRVDGYLTKPASIEELVRTILAVAEGKKVFDRELTAEAINVHGGAGRSAGHDRLPTQFEPLTHQETRVLKLMSSGLTNAKIASLLEVSPFAVKAHVRHIFRKLGVSDRTTAAILAFRTGLVSVDEVSPSSPLAGFD